MAYQAKRHKQLSEDFQLLDVEGNIVHTFHVSLDADDMVVKLNRKYTALTQTLAKTEAIKRSAKSAEEISKAFEMLGRSVTDLFEAIFGEEDTKVIVEFFDGKYVEMIKEVVPFITQCIIPRCIEIKKENQNGILKAYNRKQRRMFFKKR